MTGPQSAPRLPTYKRVVVDGVEVRAVKDADSVTRRSYEVKSCYPVYVDGVLRGHLVNRIPGFRSYTHRGWAVRSLLPWDAWDLNATGQDVAKSSEGIENVPLLLAKVPALVAEGKMPSPDECKPIIAKAIVDHEAYLARKAEEERTYQARREQDAVDRAKRAEQAEAARLEALEGLYSIRDTHGTMLSNFERQGLQAAIKAMGGDVLGLATSETVAT